MLRSAMVRFPLTSFDKWLRTEGYAPGTRAGITSRVRSLLVRMDAAENLENVTDFALSEALSRIDTSSSLANTSTAWGAFARFHKGLGRALPEITPTRRVAVDVTRENFATWLQGSGLAERSALQYSYRMGKLLRRLGVSTPEKAVEILTPDLFEVETCDMPPTSLSSFRTAWNAYLDYCEAQGLRPLRLADHRGAQTAPAELPVTASAAWAILARFAGNRQALPFFHALRWSSVHFRTAAGTRTESPATAIGVSVRDGTTEYTWNAPLDGWRALWGEGHTAGSRVLDGWTLDGLHTLVALGLSGRIERLALEEEPSSAPFPPPPM